MENGPTTAATEVAARLELSHDAAHRALNELLERRLVQIEAGGYRTLTA
jgi:DNA-binding IclR family transcriptional regulator